MCIADLGKVLLPKDGSVVEIVLEFEEVMGGVFEEKRKVFDGFPRETTLGFAKKSQLIFFSPISQFSPFLFCLAYEAKVPRVYLLLRRPQVFGDLGHNLVAMEI